MASNDGPTVAPDAAEVANETIALPPGLANEATAKQDQLCDDPANCTLINVTALPGAESSNKSDQPTIYGQELLKTGIPASDCPEATAAYEKAGYAVDGYIGGGMSCF